MVMQTDRERQRYLRAMGIQSWVSRHTGSRRLTIEQCAGSVDKSAAQSFEHNAADLAARPEIDNTGVNQGWEALRYSVNQCQACGLSTTRTQAVFGVGSTAAHWMIIGEAPGADEDRQGEPFVGRAGQLLNNMLRAIGLRRDEVYIANILKCRPPDNRDPRPDEVLKCEPYLQQQVELLQPKIILAVGRIAAHNLLKTDSALMRLRGKRFSYGEMQTPLVVTYHPAYLLRSPREKRKAWQDLLFARTICQGL